MRSLARLGRDRSAVAAVEFCLLMPVLAVLVFGGISAARAVRAGMKATAVAQIMADLVAQQASVSASDMTDFCKGLGLALAPFNGSVQASVASVTNASNGDGTSRETVDWQDTSCGSGSQVTNAITLGTPYTPNSQDSVIVVAIKYTYSFPPSYVLPSSMIFNRTSYARPRNGTKVSRS